MNRSISPEHIEAALQRQHEEAEAGHALETERQNVRLPPSNDLAEMALLGALLTNNMAVRHVSGFLRGDHFVDPVHSHIYEAIIRRVTARQLADAVTLKAEFEHTGALDDVGGPAYLLKLAAPRRPIDVREYGRCIRDAWLRRMLIDIGENVSRMGDHVVHDSFRPEAGLDGDDLAYRLTYYLHQQLDRLSNFGPPVPAVEERPLPAGAHQPPREWHLDRLLEAHRETWLKVIGPNALRVFDEETKRAGIEVIPF